MNDITPKEAIEYLLFMKHNVKENSKQDKALDLAIKALEEPEQGKFECRMKIKDIISMLLEFDMNEKATIHTTDEYKENNIIISITDTRGAE